MIKTINKIFIYFIVFKQIIYYKITFLDSKLSRVVPINVDIAPHDGEITLLTISSTSSLSFWSLIIFFGSSTLAYNKINI